MPTQKQTTILENYDLPEDVQAEIRAEFDKKIQGLNEEYKQKFDSDRKKMIMAMESMLRNNANHYIKELQTNKVLEQRKHKRIIERFEKFACQILEQELNETHNDRLVHNKELVNVMGQVAKSQIADIRKFESFAVKQLSHELNKFAVESKQAIKKGENYSKIKFENKEKNMEAENAKVVNLAVKKLFAEKCDAMLAENTYKLNKITRENKSLRNKVQKLTDVCNSYRRNKIVEGLIKPIPLEQKEYLREALKDVPINQIESQFDSLCKDLRKTSRLRNKQDINESSSLRKFVSGNRPPRYDSQDISSSEMNEEIANARKMAGIDK